MPRFDTPEPIAVNASISRGEVTITASDRTDTTVEVRPTDATNDNDVKAAQRTGVEFSGNALLVKTPKTPGFFSKGGSITVVIELPIGSEVRGDLAAGRLRSVGRLGDCKFNTAQGAIQLDETAGLRVNTASGDVTVARVAGRVDASTASGDVNLRHVEGLAVTQSASGDIQLGEVFGDIQASTASGDVAVDRAHASVSVKTASGDVKIGEAARGTVAVKTASGDIELGIGHGTAAWLDVNSFSGEIRNSLAAAGGPEASDETVKVTARSYSGSIVVRRSDGATELSRSE